MPNEPDSSRKPDGIGRPTPDRILDAAEALFAARGFAGTSVRDIANAMPVFPEVASITVCPGFSAPRFSASRIMPSARRSFTDPIGLKASTFAYISTFSGASF